MTDNTILDALKRANLLRHDNYYFIGTIIQNPLEFAMFGAFMTTFKMYSGFIINQTEEGIGIVPLNNMTGMPMIQNSYFLPQSNVSKIIVDKGGLFFYKRIIIIDNKNAAISFKVVKKVATVKNHKNNLQYFINKYNY